MKGGRSRKERPEPSAYQRALGLLVRRDHSRRELSRKLRARGVESEEADAALLVLARQDFQNDARFAEDLARTRAGAGYGPRYIRAELGTHVWPARTSSQRCRPASPIGPKAPDA